jgi:hypothetical protein
MVGHHLSRRAATSLGMLHRQFAEDLHFWSAKRQQVKTFNGNLPLRGLGNDFPKVLS